MVTPSSGLGPSRATSGNVPISTGGGSSGVTAAGPSAMACRIAAQSATVRAIGPGWSSEGAIGMIPSSGIRPCVGLIADVPQQADGIRSDPHVSLPRAAGVIRAASAAALPPLDPPATRPRSCGLPTWSVVPPEANSCVCVCPSSTTPWSRSRAQAGPSAVGASVSSSTRLEAVRGRPAIAYRSFTPIGIPHRSGVASPSRAPRVGAGGVLARALGIQPSPR